MSSWTHKLTIFIITSILISPFTILPQELVGIKAGYGHTLNTDEHINIIHIIPHITSIPFNSVSFVNLEFGQELPIGIINDSQKITGEIGMSLFGRLIFLSDYPINPFAGVILGVSFNNTALGEVMTSFNFSEQVELGLRINRERFGAFNVSFRLRHLSNGGLEETNSNFNTWHILVGFEREW